jgi:hypothetical protein
MVPRGDGKSTSGREAGLALKTKLQQLLDEGTNTTQDIEYQAKIRYQIVNSVPENWIPFIPVHVDGDNRQIQLQRAAMPRILLNDPNVPKKVEPRTWLLRQGLDDKSRSTYFMHEEEVPRRRVKVDKSFQRARWYNGQVYNWIGIRKKTGRGEGSSGLAFDQILPTE